MSMYEVNGRTLPEEIIRAMEEGRWHAEGKRWRDLIPPEEDLWPTLYDLRLMQMTNRTWRQETRPVFTGAAHPDFVPGILDPAKSLLIGEIAGDAMIALDYSANEERPSVAYLNLKFYWVRVSDSFGEFWRRLEGDAAA